MSRLINKQPNYGRKRITKCVWCQNHCGLVSKTNYGSFGNVEVCGLDAEVWGLDAEVWRLDAEVWRLDAEVWTHYLQWFLCNRDF